MSSTQSLQTSKGTTQPLALQRHPGHKASPAITLNSLTVLLSQHLQHQSPRPLLGHLCSVIIPTVLILQKKHQDTSCCCTMFSVQQSHIWRYKPQPQVGSQPAPGWESSLYRETKHSWVHDDWKSVIYFFTMKYCFYSKNYTSSTKACSKSVWGLHNEKTSICFGL